MTVQEPSPTEFRQISITRFLSAVLCLTLILCACTPGGPTPGPLQPAEVTDLPPTEQIPTLSTAPTDPTPVEASTTAPTSSMGCAYQWAYQDMPDLSQELLLAIQALQPGATGYAFTFGEDCIHGDGSVTFLPMETDFNVILPVSDITNEAALGDLTVRVMQVIENISPEKIRGPRPGRVSLLFESGADRTGVNFYIDQYQALPDNLDSSELFRTLQQSQ